MKTKPTLHLNLKRKWFDMIVSGVKKEEYREIKPYWQRVLSNKIKINGRYYHPTDVDIVFSNGYAKGRDQIKVQVEYLKVGTGNPEWGAVHGEQYFVIGLGKINTK